MKEIILLKDGELVVAHDETIERVSNGEGLICEMTSAELKKLHFNRTHPEYEHATIPTLREVFELMKPAGLMINIEMKNSRIFYKNLEEKVLKLVDELGMADKVLYSSFNHHSMLHMKAIDPKLRCGLLYPSLPLDSGPICG